MALIELLTSFEVETILTEQYIPSLLRLRTQLILLTWQFADS